MISNLCISRWIHVRFIGLLMGFRKLFWTIQFRFKRIGLFYVAIGSHTNVTLLYIYQFAWLPHSTTYVGYTSTLVNHPEQSSHIRLNTTYTRVASSCIQWPCNHSFHTIDYVSLVHMILSPSGNMFVFIYVYMLWTGKCFAPLSWSGSHWMALL